MFLRPALQHRCEYHLLDRVRSHGHIYSEGSRVVRGERAWDSLHTAALLQQALVVVLACGQADARGTLLLIEAHVHGVAQPEQERR